MAPFKYQLRRLCLIDRAIRVLNQPNRQQMIEYLEHHLNVDNISSSSFDKDIRLMRDMFNAPIKFYKHGFSSDGHYGYEDDKYVFWRCFLAYWEDYIDVPAEELKSRRDKVITFLKPEEKDITESYPDPITVGEIYIMQKPDKKLLDRIEELEQELSKYKNQ